MYVAPLRSGPLRSTDPSRASSLSTVASADRETPSSHAPPADMSAPLFPTIHVTVRGCPAWPPDGAVTPLTERSGDGVSVMVTGVVVWRLLFAGSASMTFPALSA